MRLLPKNSILTKSQLTGIHYHVIKFYTLILGNTVIEGNTAFKATNKHKLGECKHCKQYATITVKEEEK